MNNLRDYIAVEAMKSFLEKPLPEGHSWNYPNIAKSSYEMADAMMKAKDNVTELRAD